MLFYSDLSNRVAICLAVFILTLFGINQKSVAQDINDILGDIVTKSQNVSMNTAINLAGRQRMLIQKMAKAACLINLGVRARKAREEMAADMALFTRTLAGLLEGDEGLKLQRVEDAQIRAQLMKVRGMWGEFVPLLVQADSEKALSKIAVMNMELLKNMNAAVGMLERKSSAQGGATSHTVNLAGRQRMLTQKMSKEACFIARGIAPQANAKALAVSVATFDRVLKGLMDGDAELDLHRAREPAARLQLLKVTQIWRKFRPLMTRPFNKKRMEQISKLNLPLLWEMNQAVRMLY